MITTPLCAKGGCVPPHSYSRARRQWLPRPTVVAKVVLFTYHAELPPKSIVTGTPLMSVSPLECGVSCCSASRMAGRPSALKVDGAWNVLLMDGGSIIGKKVKSP